MQKSFIKQIAEDVSDLFGILLTILKDKFDGFEIEAAEDNSELHFTTSKQ